MQRDRRKRYSPARRPVLLRRVLLVLCILAVLWLGYSCMMPQLLFSARGTMIFVPDPPLRGYRDDWECAPRLLCAYSAEELFYISRLSRSAERDKRSFHGRERKGERRKNRAAARGFVQQPCSQLIYFPVPFSRSADRGCPAVPV